MEDFKTPRSRKFRNKDGSETDCNTPIKIPASPFLHKIGYGTGVHVFTLERSPKVGFSHSPWAVKKVSSLFRKNREYSSRIQIEADILRKLQHPNIVGFRAMGKSEDGLPCFAMEKLDICLGTMMEEMVENGIQEPFPAADVLKISFEIAKGLEYLHHEAHILHGDIKSYNVLVSNDRKSVKLCDFGVSIPLTTDLEMDTSVKNFCYVGTACWTAPEILRESGPVTNKADMWAYGLVIWEMLALSPPHIEIEEESFDGSFIESSDTTRMDVSASDEFSLYGTHDMDRYGVRPPLPAFDFGNEYQKVLELFHVCTDADYKSRPSAKGVVAFFNNYVYSKPNEQMIEGS